MTPEHDHGNGHEHDGHHRHHGHDDVAKLATMNEVVAELVALTGPEHAERVRALAEQARRVPATYPGQEHRTYRHELIRMRTARGLRQDQVTAATDWSLSKVIRIELGAVGISTSDMRCLAALYGADPATTERLVDEARTARTRTRKPQGPGQASYRDVLAVRQLTGPPSPRAARRPTGTHEP